ncbi:MAG: hypothetical protein JXB49_05325 [Bacteroidales bacterium]|nr:hypothetical protein [Bacteroidales bacterium]
MAINFQQNVNENTENLIRWRQRYSSAEYPYKVILNLFYDLIPIESLWNSFGGSFGSSEFADIRESDYHVSYIFREYQLSLQPVLINKLKQGVNVGGLKSKSYDKLIEKAKSKSNEAVEEIEFTYISINPLKAAFITWFSMGLIGIDKINAYNSVFNNQFPIANWSSFEDVFQGFASTLVSEISGLSKPDGTILTPSLYRPLPNLW